MNKDAILFLIIVGLGVYGYIVGEIWTSGMDIWFGLSGYLAYVIIAGLIIYRVFVAINSRKVQ